MFFISFILFLFFSKTHKDHKGNPIFQVFNNSIFDFNSKAIFYLSPGGLEIIAPIPLLKNANGFLIDGKFNSTTPPLSGRKRRDVDGGSGQSCETICQRNQDRMFPATSSVELIRPDEMTLKYMYESCVNDCKLSLNSRKK